MRIAASIAALAPLAVAACAPSTAPTATCTSVGFLGDEAGAPDFDFLMLQADETVAPLVDGDTVPMILPPQGGRVVFVGVRATNVDGCGLQLTGALRDLSTQQVVTDSRTVNLIDTHDGWGVSSTASTSLSAAISSFANVAVCPNDWASTAVYGNVFGLEVTIADREGRQVTKEIHVTPACGQPDSLAECMCICGADYVLGQTCDGGTP